MRGNLLSRSAICTGADGVYYSHRFPYTDGSLARWREFSRLSELIKSTRYGDEPLELLVLSACETAVGDSRAVLGLTGIAIKSGARSAAGSLWQIDGEATANLTENFYRELRVPGISKANALRKAQRGLIDDERFGHPSYWAAFMLISNQL